MIVACLFYILGTLQQSKQFLRIDQRIVQVIINTVQLTDRCTHVGKQHHMIHNLTNRHTRIVDEHQISREDNHQHCTYLLQKSLQTRKEIALLARR